MDKTAIKQLVADTEDLLGRALPAFEAQKKLAALEPKFNSQTEALNKLASQTAEYFVANGVLHESKRAAFIARAIENPGDIFSSMERYADSLTLQEPGSGSGSKVASLEAKGLDPIAKFAMGA